MYTYKASVVSVYDGDTITCKVDVGFNVFVKEKFRLLGINTPEIRTKELSEKEKGYAARDRLIHLIGSNDVYLQVHKKGKFGRWLADVYLNEQDLTDKKSVNNTLINEGHAIPFMINT